MAGGNSPTQRAQSSGAGMQGAAGNVVQTCPKVTLEIGVFFDGTGNNTSNANQGGGGGSYGNARSNVSLLHELYKNGDMFTEMAPCGSPAVKYASIYMQGIGTVSGGWDKNPFTVTGAGLGMGPQGVESRVYEACLKVGTEITRLSPRVEPLEIILDVFGFSRGAAAARYFVNCFRQGFVEYYAYYADKRRAYLPKGRKVRIRYVGIFDTVAAVGRGTNDDNGDVNVHVSAAQANRIWHLTAKNEYRENFRLNENLPGGGSTRSLPGAHSDVGGGYRSKGDNTVVGKSRSQVFRTRAEADAARARAAAAATTARGSRTNFWVREGWIRANEPTGGLVNTPTPVRTQVVYGMMGSSQVLYTFETGERLNRPWVLPGLSRIPLRMMYEDAKKTDVPFTSFPSGTEFTPPAALQALAPGMAMGGPTPAADKVREMLRNYGHVSSNYDSIGMSPDVNFIRVTYPNKPAEAK